MFPEVSNRFPVPAPIAALTMGQLLSRCKFNDMMPDTKLWDSRGNSEWCSMTRFFHQDRCSTSKVKPMGISNFLLRVGFGHEDVIPFAVKQSDPA